MACLGSGRRCIRGLEKLCLLGQNTQIKRKSVAYIRIKEIGIQPHARTFVQNCLVSFNKIILFFHFLVTYKLKNA